MSKKPIWKFTTGQWRYGKSVDGRTISIFAGNRPVAYIEGLPVKSKEQVFADARLIASSPRLFKALAEARLHVTWDPEGDLTREEFIAMTERWDKLINYIVGEKSEQPPIHPHGTSPLCGFERALR